jgi:hypothetical protein
MKVIELIRVFGEAKGKSDPDGDGEGGYGLFVLIATPNYLPSLISSNTSPLLPIRLLPSSE